MRAKTLEDLMEYGLRLGKRAAEREELCEQLLIMQSRENDPEVAVLRTDGGITTATVARLLIADRQPQLAVVVVEGWCVSMDPDDPRMDRIRRREIEIRDLEPPERFDVLNILGESSAGTEMFWQYRIDPPAQPAGKRVFSARETDVEIAAGNFRPLFLAPSDIQRLLLGQIPLAQVHHNDQTDAEIARLRARP